MNDEEVREQRARGDVRRGSNVVEWIDLSRKIRMATKHVNTMRHLETRPPVRSGEGDIMKRDQLSGSDTIDKRRVLAYDLRRRWSSGEAVSARARISHITIRDEHEICPIDYPP